METADKESATEPIKHPGVPSLWSLYLSEADKSDKRLAETVKESTDGILIFTGLFSATTSAFIIESYKDLQPDPGDMTVHLLAQISQQLAGGYNSTQSPFPSHSIPSNAAFRPSASTLRVNILWFLSLLLSLTCALSATLMQQWMRSYLARARNRDSTSRRGPVHAYVFSGVVSFRMIGAIELLPALLHASVFLFLAGLVKFMYAINTLVAKVILAFIVVAASSYLVLTIMPLICLNCPYRTP
ncbi:hypothetical protein BV25DRAFT_1858781, partial [Artomyces pyxidatus]